MKSRRKHDDVPSVRECRLLPIRLSADAGVKSPDNYSSFRELSRNEAGGWGEADQAPQCSTEGWQPYVVASHASIGRGGRGRALGELLHSRQMVNCLPHGPFTFHVMHPNFSGRKAIPNAKQAQTGGAMAWRSVTFGIQKDTAEKLNADPRTAHGVLAVVRTSASVFRT